MKPRFSGIYCSWYDGLEATYLARWLRRSGKEVSGYLKKMGTLWAHSRRAVIFITSKVAFFGARSRT